jgi:hypothetical protein
MLVDAAEALQPRVASGSTGAACKLKVRGPWCDTRVANEDKRRFMKKRTAESAQCRAHFDAVAVLVALGMQPNHQHTNQQQHSKNFIHITVARRIEHSPLGERNAKETNHSPPQRPRQLTRQKSTQSAYLSSRFDLLATHRPHLQERTMHPVFLLAMKAPYI